MSLLSIWAKDYKNLNFYETPLEFDRLNLLVGPNGSGKSNLIALLRFLQLSVSQSFGSVSGFRYACEELGGSHVLSFNLDRPGTVLLKYKFEGIEETRYQPIYLEIKLFISKLTNSAEIHEELLYSPINGDENNPFYYYKLHNHQLNTGVVSILQPDGSQKFQRISNVPLDSLGLLVINELIQQENEEIRELLLRSNIYSVRRHLLNGIESWRFYNANNMNLKEIRESEPKIGSGALNLHLSETGENLAAVLDELCNESFDFEDQFNDAVKQFLPMTRRIRSTRAGRLNLTIEWVVEGLDEVLYLRDMSDGSVRMLCWAIILLSHRLPSLLVIDEPEMGIHVAWMKVLAGWIEYASRQTTIIVSTHSPDLLDRFTDRSESVICHNLNNRGFASMDRIEQNQFQSRLQEGWELGDLYRVGDPSIGAWPW
ncbi:AAA family ATPase [Oxynema aestuarii]|uniref:AAA family ATPase n=1 Tax=Oxynema aestuarii AP17 TaxID=2064643 RepID=A0A6H1TUS1_9CYAN|nr:AAA family ATPase [Oxynema aestuarii]QIZ69897.1 AAA family ATPase [Oxynema aestuarii AP17]